MQHCCAIRTSDHEKSNWCVNFVTAQLSSRQLPLYFVLKDYYFASECIPFHMYRCLSFLYPVLLHSSQCCWTHGILTAVHERTAAFNHANVHIIASKLRAPL